MTVAPSGQQIELRHGDQVATVVEVGGAVRTYAVGDWEILDGYAEDEMCTAARGQPLVPWPNRLRDGAYTFEGAEHQLPLSEPETGNAIHGLVRWSSFAVADRGPDHVTMAHRLHPQPGYPFMLDVSIAYRLSDDGLTVGTTLTNPGRGRCPVGAGAHPYLTLGTPRIDDLRLEVAAATWLPTDDRDIPTGHEPVAGTEMDFRGGRRIGDVELDTTFTDLDRDPDGQATADLADERSGRGLRLWFDAAFSHFMLFTGDSLPDPDRRRTSLGVEPMTCAPDALRSGEGLAVLEPGASLAAAWGITPRG